MSEPQEYCCPITHVLMTEPVIDNEGISYEKYDSYFINFDQKE